MVKKGDEMTATVSLIEYLGSATTTATATVWDLGSTLAANLDEDTYPVSTGNYSYSKCFKLSFGGTFTSVSQIKVYKSDGAYVTGEVVNFGVSSTYHVPTGGSYQDSVGTAAIATSLPSTANITIGNSLGGTITDTENTSDYIFLQASLTTQATAQDVNQKTLTVTYAET